MNITSPEGAKKDL